MRIERTLQVLIALVVVLHHPDSRGNARGRAGESTDCGDVRADDRERAPGSRAAARRDGLDSRRRILDGRRPIA
jgi:hypothetical protein